ncbi:MAG: hypothetical protein ACP5KN_12445 [Armatimonadota bacterium]
MRSRHLLMGLLTLVIAAPAWPQDADADGILDEHEEALGTNPELPEALQLVHDDGLESEERRQAEGYDPTKDVLTVEFCHVAEDRYLWRTTFVEPPRLENTVHHLYIDADADESTGREGYGVEYMLSLAGGRPWSNHYTADGERSPGPLVSIATEGNRLLVSADCELGRDDNGVRFRMWVLCHTTTEAGEQPAMSDSTSHFLVEGIPVNDREKIVRPRDYTESHNVTGTFGLDIIRPVLRDEANVVVRYDELETENWPVDLFTSRRYGHISREGHGATASWTVRRPGRYYIGFLMYDDGSDERVGIRVNDEFMGIAVANADNNRHWIYHLSEPLELREGDVVRLEAVGPEGRHGVSRLLLMPEAPPTRQIEYAVENTHWIAPVGTDGEVSVSWTTTWPSSSRFEYGRTTEYGQVAVEECNRLVHRARLTDLEPGVTYHGRGVGIDPDGEPYYGPDVEFIADGIEPPPTREGVTQVPLTVRNPHDVDAEAWPVTGGVPFPEGTLSNVDDIRVLRDGREVMAQLKPLGTWPDGSIKWVLVTILVDVPAGESAEYVLEFGRDIDNMLATARVAPIAREETDRVTLDTGAARFSVDRHGQLVGPEGPIATELIEAERGRFSSELGDAEVTVEEYGPLRAVVKTVGDLTADDGSTSFRIEQRISAYRGQAFVQVQHTFLNCLGESEFTDVERLSLCIPVDQVGWKLLDADAEVMGALNPGTPAVWQRFDSEYQYLQQEPLEGRLGGGILADSATLAVSVRDFWQNYPKGFTATDDVLYVDLAPDFEAGLYDEFPFEEEGHHLYYYLRDGTYTLKRGMAKTHEMLIDFGRDEAALVAHPLIFRRPLLLTAQPQWYCDSMAFYSVAPRDEERFAAYEEAIDRNLERYVEMRERQRDFGMMNYGDWYGERGSNWGNIEYDTQHAFFLEYIRSGNPDAFLLGHVTELHNRDIDTVHWSSDPRQVGAVYIHQMGHVGGYYDQPVPDTLGFPSAGYTVSHAWTEGHFDHYFLTGDPRSLATGTAVADFFTDKQLSRPYDWTSCRTPGWHLIMLASALAATNDPYYLNAARVVVDRVLETQDVEPRELPEYQKEPGRTHQVGGWSRMMVPGHCHCEPRHRGNAGFMVAILLTGLTYYHDVTQEPAVREAIIRGAHYLLDECYSEETHGFRYTSCPNTRYGSGASPLMVEGVARAYRWTQDERFLDPLTHGLALGAGGSAYGKGFSMYYRCAPRLLADLAAVGLTLEEHEREALAPFEKPEWMTELPDERLIVIQAEDFVEQGEGQVEVRDDRHATWGTMLTKWHADVGHWLQGRLQVPQDGRYRLIFRYATGSENARRRIEIDGEPPHGAAEEFAFPHTGGYGTNPADWQYRPLQDAEGNEVAVPLSAGEHTIRMTNLGDGLGLDFISLVRED